MLSAWLLALCRMCGKHRHPKEFVGGGPVTGYCWHCYEWHRKAWEALEGRVEPECCFCAVKPSEVAADLVMRIYRVDGMYAMTCIPCGHAYEKKRLDMFGQTPYGHKKGLHSVT